LPLSKNNLKELNMHEFIYQDTTIIKHSKNMYVLIDKIISEIEERKKENIIKWAEKLSKDLSKYND
jgi:hypothetical protein